MVGIGSAALVIAAITALARVAGFGRWVVSASTVGRGCVGDVYAAANQIPNVIYEVAAGGALAAAVVPVVTPMIRQQDSHHVKQTTSALLTWCVLITLPMTLALLLLAGPVGALLVPGRCASPESSALAAWLVRVFAVQIMLYAIGTVATGVLQAHRRFLAPALAPLLSSVVVIAAYVMVGITIDGHEDRIAGLPTAARDWLGWGTTAGVVALSVPLLLPLTRAVPGLRARLRFPAGVAATVSGQAAGGMVALLAQQVFVVTVLILTRTGNATVGSLNLFQYTQAIFLLPFAVLVIPLATSAFPALAAAHDESERFTQVSAQTLRTAIVVSWLGVVALVVAAPALEVFFGAIESSGRGAQGMAAAVVTMVAGLPGLAVVTQTARALQARRQVRQAALGTSLAWLGAAVAAAALVALTDLEVLLAVCAGSTIGLTTGAIALVRWLRRGSGAAATAGAGRVLLVGGAAALGIGGLGWWVCQAAMTGHPGAGFAVLIGSACALVATTMMVGVALFLEPGLRTRLTRTRG